jgi:hypothetical protein
MPNPVRAKERLAYLLLWALNKDNWEPCLDWTKLHPAVGVPLLMKMIKRGFADALGLPVFVQQAKLPTDLTVAEYHAWTMQRPFFVGRYVRLAGWGMLWGVQRSSTVTKLSVRGLGGGLQDAHVLPGGQQCWPVLRCAWKLSVACSLSPILVPACSSSRL